MAGVSFVFKDDGLLAALERLSGAAQPTATVMNAIGAHFVFSTQRNIETETAPDGKRWPALSPRTAEKRIGRRRRGFDHMLRVSGRLYQSISYRALENSVEWGTNLVYGRIHQLGGVIDQPARQGKVSLKTIRKAGSAGRRFVREGTKGSETKLVSIRAHQVQIPARPYLGVSEADRSAVLAIINDHLEREVAR